MALPLLAAGISLLPSVYQAIKGISQTKQANKINPLDPKYQMNGQVIDNARILGERYGNYQMPNFQGAKNQIDANSASSFNNGIQGASSSGDVLDLASKIAYGSNEATNNLNIQNAIGKEGALKDYLGANALAGQEYQDKNAYEREEYMQKLREKAALSQAGTENVYGAAQNFASTGTGLAMSGLMGNPREITRINGIEDTPISTTQMPNTYNSTLPMNTNSTLGMSEEAYLKMLMEKIMGVSKYRQHG